ncbi:MAG: hypothetical protein ACHP9S_04810 [Terriglobales bacterium]
MVFRDVLAAFLALFWLKPVAKSTYLKAQEMQRLEDADAARAAAAAALAA